MKKYLPYLVVIVLLAGAAIWYKVYNSPEAIKDREGDFAYAQTEDIYSIIMTSSDGRKIDLKRNGDKWKVNDKYDARPDLIQHLFEAFGTMTSLAPVPGSAHDNVIRDLMNNSVTVELRDKSGDLLKSYMVGGATVDGENTYMLNMVNGKPASRPHMVYIPGFHGSLLPRFEMDEEVWRVRTVYGDNYTGSGFMWLKVDYPANPENSFSVSRVAPNVDSFKVEPLDAKYAIDQPYKQKYVRQYVSFFNNVSIEAYDNTNSHKDSIMQTTPYCMIITGSDMSYHDTTKLYYMPINKRSKAQYDLAGKELTYDIDRYYASINNGKDFAIVQYYVFGKLLRNYKDFFFKPEKK
ncbi:MAG: hypothetical protein U0V74_09510 [Chitinophagales bacterium]